MSAPFAVGEVVIGQNFIFWPELNGMECEITEAAKLRPLAFCHRSGIYKDAPQYVVTWADGAKTYTAANNLRRRKPPTTGEESLMQLIRDTLDKAPMRVKEPA